MVSEKDLNRKLVNEQMEECERVVSGAMKLQMIFLLVAQIPLAVLCSQLNGDMSAKEGFLCYYFNPVLAEVLLVLVLHLLHKFCLDKLSFRTYSVLVMLIVSAHAEIIVLAYPEAVVMPAMLLLPIVMLSVFRSSKAAIFQMIVSFLLFCLNEIWFVVGLQSMHGGLWKALNVIAFFVILFSFFLIEEQVRKATTMLDVQSSMDSLTGLYNHEAFYLRLEKEMENFEKTGEAFSIFIADIDNFKKVNDTYGHVYGDMVLETVSSILKESCGSRDFVSRYGGEEFAALLPGCGKNDAIGKADKVRKSMESMEFETTDGIRHFTISVGVAEYDKTFSGSSAFVDLADEALYDAKSSGKNRVCFRK